jgi:carbon-monoxide dehydrogenase medium subunit
MYATEFEYYRATSIGEAGDLLKKHPGAKLLAGGHSLIPLLKLRLVDPPALIDIGRIAELKGVTIADGVARVGALTTHAELAASPELHAHCPAVAEAAQHIGDPAVRNRGTIGGNVAHADPASDLPCVLTALGARFVVVGPGGTRTIEAGSFFQGLMATALGEHDVLAAVEVPAQLQGQGAAYVKFVHPASRYAVIGAAAKVTIAAGTCTAAAVALGGLVARPVRAESVERALTGQPVSAAALAKAAENVSQDLKGDLLGDIFASAEYRRAVAPVWVKRAIAKAAERAGAAA